MDGRGRAIDNVFIERLLRSVKYEEVYLNDYTDGWHAEAPYSFVVIVGLMENDRFDSRSARLRNQLLVRALLIAEVAIVVRAVSC